MGLRRGVATTVIGCVLALVPVGAVAADPARDDGFLQQKHPNVNYRFDDNVDDSEVLDFTVPVDPVPVGGAISDVVAVNAASTDSGCDPGDFAGFPPGSIALVRRGDCFFADKVLNAQAAGATGVLIFNSVPGLIVPSLTGADVTIPVLFLTQALGESFADTPDLRVHMRVHRQPPGSPGAATTTS